MTVQVGETHVIGKTGDQARALLAAAELLGLEPEVVRSVDQGFTVPSAVAELAFAPAEIDPLDPTTQEPSHE